MHDLLDVTVKQLRLGQHRHDAFLGTEDSLSGDLGVVLPAPFGGDPLGRLAQDAAVAAHNCTGGQLQLTPPGHIGQVAERADHGNAGTLVGLRQGVGANFHLNPEKRRGDLLAKQRLVALVVRVRDKGRAGCQQFRTRGFNVNLGAVFGEEREPVISAGHFPVLKLGLGHGGAEGDIPQRGGFGHVGVAGRKVRQEPALGHRTGVVVDGAVRQDPVNRQAQRLEQVLKDLLVLDGELFAEFDEVLAGDHIGITLVFGRGSGRPVVGVVRGLRIATHTVVVLHAALGGEAVVVPAHRVEDVFAAHALEAGQHVRLRVGEHVPHVQRPGRGRRGSVNGVHLLPRGLTVELVGPLGEPALGQGFFKSLQNGLVGNVA